MALASGAKLGPYEIVAPLGAGGMGEVYRARDTRLDRTVAVKILPAHLSSNLEAKQRFEREARAISSLNHPNICTLHDVGHQDGTDFLVMEYLEGETLADRLAKGPLPPEQVLRYGIDICEGLEKAHKSGVVHRDLKPGNVMLTKSGAKLLDFGLAKPLGATVASGTGSGASPSVFAAALTQTMPSPSPATPLSTAGAVIGTVQYMSPEQIQGIEADARSDIFSFGVMLFEMVTGKRTFEGKTQASIVGQILAVDPPSVSTLRPQTPPGLERVIRLCLDKDPDERIQTAHDLKLQLQAVAEAPAMAPLGGGRSACHCHHRVHARLLTIPARTAGLGPLLHPGAGESHLPADRKQRRTAGALAGRAANRLHSQERRRQANALDPAAELGSRAAHVGNRGRNLSVLVRRQPLRGALRRWQAEQG
jgi:serine/threonine protein kinase